MLDKRWKKKCFLRSKGINFLYSCNYCQVCKEGFINVYPTQGLFKCRIHLRSGLWIQSAQTMLKSQMCDKPCIPLSYTSPFFRLLGTKYRARPSRSGSAFGATNHVFRDTEPRRNDWLQGKSSSLDIFLQAAFLFRDSPWSTHISLFLVCLNNCSSVDVSKTMST